MGGAEEEELVHDSQESLDHAGLLLVLQGSLVIPQMGQDVLNESLKEIHCELRGVQVGLAAQSLLKVAQERGGIGRVTVLGELEHGLELDDETREVEAVEVRR